MKNSKQYFMINKIDYQRSCKDNATTTKLLAVKPSRNSLAIFMLNQGATNLIDTKSIMSCHIFNAYQVERIISYDGLIGVNKKPKGNSPSRLVAVVEKCSFRLFKSRWIVRNLATMPPPLRWCLISSVET